MRRRAALAASFCLMAAAPAAPTPDEQNFTQVQQGHYLVVVGDCAACHTAPGGKPFAGGRPIATPFGIVVSPNITPDRETGIGAWTNADFVRVMQDGIARGGKHLYPAMPYEYYTHEDKSDDLAMRAWLATLPAVHNKVVSDQLPFPLSIRLGMIGWNWLYFHPGRYKDDPSKSAEWNRGASLVAGLEHCGACHTPKNVLGADDSGRALQGNTVQGWYAPNITNDDRRGIGRWSVGDVVDLLRTGHNRFTSVAGPMAEEVRLSSSEMAASDLHAIAVYLKSLPGQADRSTGTAPPRAVMRDGARIYADECSACHAPKGQGVPGMFPTLAGSPSVNGREPTSVIRVVLQGAKSASTKGAPTGPAMPAFGWLLSDKQVAAVATYVRNAWGNAAPVVDAGDVSGARARLASRTD